MSNQEMIVFYTEKPLRIRRDPGLAQRPMTDAEKFSFEGGTAAARTVYVPHPTANTRLVPFAQYDDLLMKAKFEEALRIVQTLGAAKVRSTTVRRRSTRLSLQVSPRRRMSGSLQGRRSAQSEIAFEQDGAGGDPVDPAPLLFPHEPGFEPARRAVLFGGAKHVTINIENKAGLSVQGDIASRLRRAGLNLGAAADREHVQLYRLEAFFPGYHALQPNASPESDEAAAPNPTPRRRWGNP